LIAEAEQARTLAAAFLAYDQALTAWAAHPSATAPVDDTYATMKQLAQQILGDESTELGAALIQGMREAVAISQGTLKAPRITRLNAESSE
jgi:hypothetical protein